MEQKQNQSVKFAIAQRIDLQASFDASGLTSANDRYDKNDVLIHTDRRRKTLEKMGDKAKWMHKDVIVVRVLNSIRDRIEVEVTESHKRQFPEAWQAFLSSPQYQAFVNRDEDEPTTYRDVKDMAGKVKGVGPATIRDLQSAGIKTVEQLAEADPNSINHIRKWEELQEAAIGML